MLLYYYIDAVYLFAQSEVIVLRNPSRHHLRHGGKVLTSYYLHNNNELLTLLCM